MSTVIGKQKHYIINPTQIEPTDVELVGYRAVSLTEITKAGVPTPDYFVVTSVSFDDFIIASGLVEKLSQIISQVNPDQPSSADIASEQINSLISQAIFPSTVLHPLIQAYKSLCGISDKYVELIPSYIYPDDLVPESEQSYLIENIKGEAALLYAVKQVWASLFSAKSLLHRQQRSYASGLSVALIVRRAVQAESSGLGYSLDPITTEPDFIVIEALLGLRTNQNYQDPYDIYKLDAKDCRILEKSISTQDQMYIRKAKIAEPANPYMIVPISSEWKRRQKIEDVFIVEIAKLITKIKHHLHSQVEISWSYEVGKVYITGINPYQKLDLPQLRPEIDITKSNPDLEVIPATQPAYIDMPGQTSPKQETANKSIKPELKIRNKINMNKLVSEVNDIVDGKIEIPDTTADLEEDTNLDLEIDNDVPITADIPSSNQIQQTDTLSIASLRDGFSMATQMYLDLSKLESEYLAAAPQFDGMYFDASETVARQSSLPETTTDREQIAKIIEHYAIDVSTAAKAANDKPLLLSFSNLVQTDSVADGAERFIAAPQALITELLGVKKAITQYGAHQISFVIPGLRSVAEISDIKKIMATQNLKRTKSVGIYAELSMPSLGYQLADMDPDLVDGVIINLPRLLPQLLGTQVITRVKFNHALSAIRAMCDQLQAQGIQTSVLLGELANLDFAALAQIGFHKLIFAHMPDQDTLRQIQLADAAKLSGEFGTRRGRRPKVL